MPFGGVARYGGGATREGGMVYLIWGGAVMALAGVAGLRACAVGGLRLRRAGLTDAALRDRLNRVVAYNLGALGIATIGLMAVILGLFLR